MTLFLRMVAIFSLGLLLTACGGGGGGGEGGGDSASAAEAVDATDFTVIKGANDSVSAVTSDFTLPASHANGTSFSWSSSNTECVTHSGTVMRPDFGEGNCEAKLTLAGSKGGATSYRYFYLTVLEQEPTDAEAVAYVKSHLTFADIAKNNSAEDSVTSSLNLTTEEDYGVSVSWAATDSSVNTGTGAVTQPARGSSDVAVTLTATLSKGLVSDTKAFNLTVKALTYNLTYTYSGSGAQVFLVDPMNGHDFNVTLNLGSSYKNVYFVFSNISETNATAYPGVTILSSFSEPLSAKGKSLAAEEKSIIEVEQPAGKEPPMSGKPSVTAFNDSLKPLTPKPSSGIQASIFEGQPTLHKDVVGGTGTLKDNTGAAIAATVRKVIDIPGKTLNIWVANDTWDSGCGKTYCVTQTMIDSLGDKFLKSGSNNDIYDWVTNIFGAEWGDYNSSLSSYFIPYDGNITIFVLDIDSDHDTFEANGGTVGFFYARDNFKTTSGVSGTATSNQRIMFYMDGPMLAADDGGGWSEGAYWPQAVFSTLAHEFQHMIHYYQKNVTFNVASTDTWINEMCSLATEDFVSYKLQVDGPRGVEWSNGTAGSSTSYYGRLYLYNKYNYTPLAEWMNGSGETSVLNSYATAYAFGAYLARNFGGPELFRKIVQNEYTDKEAIEAAMTGMGYDENLTTLIPKWGAANMLSNLSSTSTVPEKYRYNKGGFFDYTLDGIQYRLGSINLWNYYYKPSGRTGSMPTTGYIGRYNTSNAYFQASYPYTLSGAVTRSFSMPADGRLTIVVR